MIDKTSALTVDLDGDGGFSGPPAPVSLDRIKEPIEAELQHFRSHFRESMCSDVWLLDKITRYVLHQKGKRIRPMLVLLSCKMFGDITDRSYRAAALVELLHTATLVHDDVVDDAERRRGLFSINALWKNKIAVLVGDFLLSRGLLLALDHKDYPLLHTLSDAVRRMSEGELLQIEKSRFLNIDEETYFRIISDKTGSLIAACTAIGAQSAGATDEEVDRLRTIGERIGVAFQIRDDLFDYGVEDVGKPLGIDLKERKMTLPLIRALQTATPSERKRYMAIVRKKKKSRQDIRRVATFVAETGGLQYAREAMERYALEARELLLTFPAAEARNGLVSLVDYMVTRKH